MRKAAVFLCLVLALLLFSGCNHKTTTEDKIPKQYTHGIYEVALSAHDVFNNSVGENWEETYSCQGKEIKSLSRWMLPLDVTESLTICVIVVEMDKWPDVGYGSLSVSLQDGFKTSTVVTVTENKGKYQGNKAQREIVCRVHLVEKLETVSSTKRAIRLDGSFCSFLLSLTQGVTHFL